METSCRCRSSAKKDSPQRRRERRDEKKKRILDLSENSADLCASAVNSEISR